MKEFRKFPSIGQFRNAYRTARHQELGVVEYEGTVKLHGSNAGVLYDPVSDEMWVQSRGRIITPEDDNYGFAKFVKQNETWIQGLFTLLIGRYHGLTDEVIGIFGEWAGQGVNSGSAIANIDRAFFIFAAFAMDQEPKPDHKDKIRLNCTGICARGSRIFNIHDYLSFRMEVDYQNPQDVAEKTQMMAEWVTQVESKCPVASTFGHDGIGEGIVWTPVNPLAPMQLMFKTKGEKHSESKVKTLIPLDPEKATSIEEFVSNVVTEARVKQAIHETQAKDIKDTGRVLKWVSSDILKEESDTLEASGLTMRDVGKQLSNKARKMWMEECDKV